MFGLAFFALLLTQINMVNELMGMDTAEAKQQKDQVLQFLRSRNVDQELIVRTDTTPPRDLWPDLPVA